MDARKIKESKETTKPKPPPATKLGSYLLDEAKINAGRPGPIYEIVKPWFNVDKKKT